MKSGGINQTKALQQLQQKRTQARKDEIAESVVVTKTLQNVINMLPASILLKHNKLDECKDRAKTTMIRTITKLLLAFVNKGFRQWKLYVRVCQMADKAHAARRIATVVLGFIARTKVRKLRRILLLEAEEIETLRQLHLQQREEHAMTIQRVIRGRGARRDIGPALRRREAARFIWNFYVARKKIGKCRQILRQKGWEKWATHLLQRVFRGHMGRQKARRMRVIRHRMKVQLRYASKFAIFEYYFEQVGAAIKIQKWFRRLPWYFKAKWRQKHAKFLAKKKEQLQFGRPAVQLRAAKLIQRVGRGYLGRCVARRARYEVNLVKQERHRQRCAAVIQAWMRGYLTRRRYPLIGQRTRMLQIKMRRWKRRCLHQNMTAQRSWSPVDEGTGGGKSSTAPPSQQMLAKRRRGILFPNILLGSVDRIVNIFPLNALKIQCIWRVKLARLLVMRMKAARVAEKTILIQKWMRRMVLVGRVVRMRHQYMAIIAYKKFRHRCAGRIQKLYRRVVCNEIMLDRLHAMWLGVRTLQRWCLVRNAHRRCRHVLASRRVVHEFVAAGQVLCTKTLLFLNIEFTWAGIRKTSSLDVHHELQLYYLSISGQTRMLDVLKILKVCKALPGFFDDVLINSNVIELQFSKVKALTEKKLDYLRFLDLLANLAAIRLMGISSVAITGAMAETPLRAVIPPLRKATGASTATPHAGGMKSKARANASSKAVSVSIAPGGTGGTGGDSEAKVALRNQMDSYRFGRLTGKAALITKFVMTFLFPTSDYQKILHYPAMKDKTAPSFAESYLDYAVRRIQAFLRKCIVRKRWLIAKKAELAEAKRILKNRRATLIQSIVRGFLGRRRSMRLAQKMYTKYHDGDLQRDYWYNGRTGRSFWVKPKLLGFLDCGLPVRVPNADEQFPVVCSYCTDATATQFCDDCDDPYCSSCYVKAHKAGHRRDHLSLPLTKCIECDFQAGVRLCLSCKDAYCDSCFRFMHSKGRHRLHVFKWTTESCCECAQRAAQWTMKDLATDKAMPYCTVCFKDKFGDPTTEVISGATKSKFIGKAVADHRAAVAKAIQDEEIAAEYQRTRQLAMEKKRAAAIATIQRVWRGRHLMKLLAEFIQERKAFLILRKEEMPLRKTMWYKIRQYLGFYVHLRSDTTLEKVEKMYPPYMRHIVAACVEDNWVLACQLLDEHEDHLKMAAKRSSGQQGGAVASIANAAKYLSVTWSVGKADLALKQHLLKLHQLTKQKDRLATELEEAKAIEGFDKAEKQKLVNDLKVAESALAKAKKHLEELEENLSKAMAKETDFLGPRGLQRLVRERRRNGVLLPITVTMTQGSRVALSEWKSDVKPPKDANAALGLWRSKLKEGDVILVNGVTCKIVRKSKVFKKSPVVRPLIEKKAKDITNNESTTAGLSTLKEEGEEDEEDDIDDDTPSVESKKTSGMKSALDSLAELNLEVADAATAQAIADKENALLKEQEMAEEDFTVNHIALDRVWVLPSATGLSVYKVVPTVFYKKPINMVGSLIEASYPVQKSIAIAAITLHKLSAVSKRLGEGFDDDSEAGAKLKDRAVRLELSRDRWLRSSYQLVNMSYDFTLRRQVYGMLRLVGRTGYIFARAAYKRMAKNKKKVATSPYEIWEESPNKDPLLVFLDVVDGEDAVRLGEINIDFKAPSDVLREYIRRNFRDVLNESVGDAFNFQYEKKNGKLETVLRKNEFSRYTKDIVSDKMDRATMETNTAVILVREKGVNKIFIKPQEIVDKEAADAAAGAGGGAEGGGGDGAVAVTGSAKGGGGKGELKRGKSKPSLQSSKSGKIQPS